MFVGMHLNDAISMIRSIMSELFFTIVQMNNSYNQGNRERETKTERERKSTRTSSVEKSISDTVNRKIISLIRIYLSVDMRIAT